MSELEPLSIVEIREKLGHMWGLERSLTSAELARALMLGPDHIGKLQKGTANFSGPVIVALRMMLAGAVPHTMADVVKPGYPRGAVR